MIIKRVQATNLKGRTFGYDLESMNVVTGENFVGKSTIIDAIRLALIGYLPELGKTNSATAQLSSDQSMSVRATFDNGDYTELALLPNGKILRNGFEFTENIPLLNASAYFAMSERERYDYVFRIAKLPEGFTTTAAIAEIERISFEEAHTEAIEKAKGELLAILRRECSPGLGVREFLDAVIPACQAEFTTANARSKDTQGAIRVMAELKNRQEHMAGNARQLAEVEERARSNAEVAYAVLRDLQAGAAQFARYQERAARVKELTGSLDPSGEIAKLGTLIDEATAMLKKDIDSKVSEAELEQLQSHVDRLRRDEVEAGAQIVAAKDELSQLGKRTECPYCKSKGKDWKANLHVALTNRIDVSTDKLASTQSILKEADIRLKESMAEVRRAAADLAHNKRLSDQILGWNQQISRLNRQRDGWAEQLEREQGLLQKEKCDPVAKADIELAELAATKAKQALADARERLRSAELLEHELKRAAQAEIEHNDAAARVVVVKKVLEVLRAKKAELVDAVFGDLLKVANSLASHILLSPLAFHEGEVGRWDGHRWITHKTFSGTEQALAFVAIAMALSQSSPLKLLIFDELGRLDARRRFTLFNALGKSLKAGHIDQFIIAGALNLAVAYDVTSEFANEINCIRV